MLLTASDYAVGRSVLSFLLGFLVVMFVFMFISKKYNNIYKLIMVFGKKGSGKSTLIAKLAKKYIKKGFVVYSNIPLYIDGVRVYNPYNIGAYVFPKNSVVFVDEAGIIYDNRHYKDFTDLARDYYKLQRHYGNVVYLFSQTFDIDSKLRALTDYMFMVNCYGNIFSVAHRISRRLVVVEPTGDSEGRIADGFVLTPLWLQIVGMRIVYFTFIPRWVKYFNSFEAPERPFIPYDLITVPSRHRLFRRKKEVNVSDDNEVEHLSDDQDVEQPNAGA